MTKITCSTIEDVVAAIRGNYEKAIEKSMEKYTDFRNAGGKNSELIRAGLNFAFVKALSAAYSGDVIKPFWILRSYALNAMLKCSLEKQTEWLVTGVYSASSNSVCPITELTPLDVRIVFDEERVRSKEEQEELLEAHKTKMATLYTIEGSNITFHKKCSFHVKDLFKILYDYIMSKFE